MFPINPDFMNVPHKKGKKQAKNKQISSVMKLTSKLVSKMTTDPQKKKDAKKAFGELAKKLKDFNKNTENTN